MGKNRTKSLFVVLAFILVIGISGIVWGIAGKDDKTENTEKHASGKEEPVVYSSTENMIVQVTPPTPVELELSEVIDSAEIDEDGFTYDPEDGKAVDGVVHVVSESVTIREKAGVNSDALGVAYKGETFAWIAAFSTDGWVSVDYNGTVAYLNGDYVKVDGITDRSDEVFTAGVDGMSVPTNGQQSSELLITPLPTNTPTPTPTSTPTPTPTSTPTPTPTPTTAPVYVPSDPGGNGDDIISSVSDEILLTCIVATESGGDYSERLAVASVVVNRCNSKGQSMYEVVSAPYQFSVYSNGVLSNAIQNYLDGSGNFTDCHNAAVEVLNGGPTVHYQSFRAYYDGIENDFPGGQRIGATWFH